jgi:hypothetical protein
MSTKKKTKAPAKKDPNTINAPLEKGQSKENKLAKLMLSPSTLNAVAAQEFIKPTAGEIDLEEAILITREKTKKVNDGDLSELEATLIAQVVSLNTIFAILAKRSDSCNYMNQMETNLLLALKAQAQCARTIEVLAAIKNPPVVFAKQANIAHGHQQVNNGRQSTHAGKTNPPNELLNEANHATLDTRGTAEASRANQDMATVETINGSKDSSRQSQVKPERL